jgi:hypothetical protein
MIAVLVVVSMVAAGQLPAEDDPNPQPNIFVATFGDTQEEPKEEAADQPATPADQYRALLQEYRQVRRPEDFAPKFLQLARENPEDPVAIDALVWVVSNFKSGEPPREAIGILLEEHIQSEKLGDVCAAIGFLQVPHAEQLLRGILAKSPHESVQAQACFHLAGNLKQQIELANYVKTQPDLAKRIEQYVGSEYAKQLASLDEKYLTQQIEQLYERSAKSFSEFETVRGKMGQIAERELFELRHLAIGKVAPDIEGTDIDGVPFKLSDYRGKVVVLDFWGHW